MNKGWSEFKLGEVLTIKYGKDHKKLNTGKVPCYGTGGIMRYVEKFLSEEESILLPRKGSLNNIYYVNKPFWTVDTLFWSQINKEKCIAKYIFYVMSGIDLAKLNVGSAIPSLTVPVLNDLSLNLPPLPEQKAIAHILGTLDAKIELNRKMNETLEAMAQALFKSWFVDFDPVLDNALAQGNDIPEALKAKAERRKAVKANGEYKALPAAIQKLFPAAFVYNEELGKWIPEGWGNSKLESLVKVKYGKDHKKLKEGKYPCYGSGGVMRYVEQALCELESVLIPRKGSLNNMMYVREPFWSVDTMFFTLFEKKNMVKFLFYYLKKFNFAEMNVGSAVPSMTTKVLNDIDLIIPSEIILENYEKQVELIITRKEANIKLNKNLIKTRDFLLSQLISGKTRLPKTFIQQFETKTALVS